MAASLAGIMGVGKGLPPAVRCVRAGNPGPLTGEGTNSWLLGQGEILLVDPGPDLPAHHAALMAALAPGERITQIVLTHPHADHAALCPRMDLPVRPLQDGDVLQGSWGRITALHTPGHHPDHFCLIGPGWAITGDHVMGWSSTLVAPPEGRMADYMSSLDRLEATDTPLGLPGHGPVIPDLPARIRALRHHRQTRATAVLAAVRGGHNQVSAITAKAYGPLDPALTQAATANCLAHLIDLAERNLINATPPFGPKAIFSAK
ncbi:MBL fold metallo-hydrolase [Neogemmobacter tilapiae]|uniref:MBL fold hydrolase n=1 Tax=Neogemmobacter tilapiae TaxID=875041 RepID=A0A918TS30_9RHOB|nr:MBL fold metallo-hydrolase [Gemmobacter tilapiae]GHC59621.1 MBL fold hydrolase [Gemmobacter tilapiae]